jgi:hypothetical protein
MRRSSSGARYVAQLLAQVINEVVGVVVFGFAGFGFPVVQEIPNQVAEPFATGLVVFLGLALRPFVVMVLDDRSTSSSPQPKGDDKIPGVFWVECHRLIVAGQLSVLGRKSVNTV